MAVIWLEEIGLRDLDLSLTLRCLMRVDPLRWFHFVFYICTCVIKKPHKWCRFQLSYFDCGFGNGQFVPITFTYCPEICLTVSNELSVGGTLSFSQHTEYYPYTLFLFFPVHHKMHRRFGNQPGLLVLIWTNDADEIKTMKKFRPSFTTASRCDFDLIKLWAKLLRSILNQPR